MSCETDPLGKFEKVVIGNLSELIQINDTHGVSALSRGNPTRRRPYGSFHFLGTNSACTWDRGVGGHYDLVCIGSRPVVGRPAKNQPRPTQAGPGLAGGAEPGAH